MTREAKKAGEVAIVARCLCLMGAPFDRAIVTPSDGEPPDVVVQIDQTRIDVEVTTVHSGRTRQFYEQDRLRRRLSKEWRTEHPKSSLDVAFHDFGRASYGTFRRLVFEAARARVAGRELPAEAAEALVKLGIRDIRVTSGPISATLGPCDSFSADDIVDGVELAVRRKSSESPSATGWLVLQLSGEYSCLLLSVARLSPELDGCPYDLVLACDGKEVMELHSKDDYAFPQERDIEA
ncbi:MAG: hypothetical protein H6807_15080 [Planctomycetes bacterium]|nr:hypothetical protein [Planctomycetota bacterium]